MKNKFTSGIITGAVISFMICTIFFSVQMISYRAGLEKSNADLVDIIQENQSKSDTGTKNQLTALENKMLYMKGIVSKFFLYDVTDEAYNDSILKGMMAALDDPYSCYFTKDEYEEMNESIDGTYCGIGAYVGQDRDTLVMTITKPFVDGPAAIAGVLPGDIIYKVDNEDVTGQDISMVVAKMKGEKGTKVKLTVFRGNDRKEHSFDITRDEIEVPTVASEMLKNDIGYIAIAQFDKVTVDQFIKAVDDMEKKEAKGLIIDLRDNGGGLYGSCISMLDRIIGKGLLVYTETKDGTKEEQFAKTKEKYDKPLVILVNGNSASASEIFAGAIQDYGAGEIVGTQTFGKGIVQSVIPLFDGSAMKLTVSNYFTPKGRSIHKVGITPDVVVELDPSLTGLVTREQDNQLHTAISEIEKMIGAQN